MLIQDLGHMFSVLMLNFKITAMIKYFKQIIPLTIMLVVLWSCEDDLNVLPEDDRLTQDAALISINDFESFLAKAYGGLSLTGQDGPEGDGDIQGIGEDFSSYMRLYYQLQELPTDEAVIAWNDQTIQDLNTQLWTSSDPFSSAFYSRIFFQVAVINEFLRQTDSGNIEGRGFDLDVIRGFRAEARFLRALSYWHALDLYGSPTFVTEDRVGLFSPEQISRADLFEYIESELLAIENEIAGPRENQYGRADRGAVWALLSKLYLNSEVYLGEGNGRFNDCIDVCNRLINAGYSIDVNIPYSYLFLADNDLNGAQSEAIFTIPYDGVNTQSFGGSTFLVHAAVGGSMVPADFGINGGWAGIRSTEVLIDLFGEPTNNDEADDVQREWEDKRLISHTPGQTLEIESLTVFEQGYGITKFKNIKSDGTPGSDPNVHPDTDFHMFRLSDIYLTYAEATLRGATNGDLNTALNLINTLRVRAHEGSADFNVSADDLTLDFIIDERSRELYWENHRRTDLVRYNQFSENTTWPFKGGVPNGQTTPAFRDLYPIPQNEIDVNANPLQQNPGY